MKTFENYLEEICFEENLEILDDDRPDFFDSWIIDQTPSDVIEWAEKWHKEVIRGIGKELDKIGKILTRHI